MEVHLTVTVARNGRLLPLDVDPDWDEEGGVSGPEAHAARQAVRADRQPQKRSHTFTHTRRINTEEKAKVGAAVWG